MRVDAFHNWRRELEAVEQEMNSLMAEGLPASNEERHVRRTRFAALIERREAAARNLLRSDSALRRGKSPAGTPGPGDLVIAAAHTGGGSEGQPDAFVSLPEGTRKAEAQPEGAMDRPATSTDTATPDLDAAADPIAVDPTHPAEPLIAPESAVVADPGNLAAEIAAPAPDADSLVLDFAAPNPPADTPTADAPTADAWAEPAEPQADLFAVAPDSAALASGSGAVPPSVGSEDAAASAAEIVAAASAADIVAAAFDAAPPASDAAVPATAVSIAAAEPATDVVALAPDAAVPATAESSADKPSADKSSADEPPADESPAESVAPSDHPVGDLGATHPSGVVMGPAEAASVVIAAELQPAPPPEDAQSEALLLKLLRRLQLGPGTKRT